MYNERIENLISAALADGALTEKEKQILFKNAEAQGIDLDEFEMILDARLVELQKREAAKSKEQEIELAKAKAAVAQTVQSSAPKSNKFGDVRKCPACGAMIQSFMAKCPDCGLEFSNIEANSSMERLSQMLNEAEKENNDISLTTRVSNLFNPVSIICQRKIEIINNFPIPNTKDDLLEFITLAYPKAKKLPFFSQKTSDDIAMNKAWKAKIEQLFIKARLAMKDDDEVMMLVNKYAKELKIKL